MRPLTAAIVFGALAIVAEPAAIAAFHPHTPPVKLDPNVPEPVIAFDRTHFDFGSIAAGQKVEHAFIVTNTGRAVLRIEKPHASCGCTSATIGQQELKPGESTEILAVYTAQKDFTGAMRKSILVVSNDPLHSKWTLRLAGNVLPPTQAAPSASPGGKPLPPAAANRPAVETSNRSAR